MALTHPGPHHQTRPPSLPSACALWKLPLIALPAPVCSTPTHPLHDRTCRTLPPVLKKIKFPVIGAPLFIISNPKLVIAQCKAGVVGSMPALNARPASQLDEWLAEITEALAAHDKAHPDSPAAPFAINQIVHKSNDRLEHDMQVCARYKVPIIITSLGAREDVNRGVQAWGGVVLHDVISNVFAHKAIEKGADGLIPVAAGAGGHASVKSPFAMVAEIREWFGGPVALSGAISSGGAILAAQAMGADFAYIGSAFIATEEARAAEDYKKMITECNSDDIIYSNFYTGIHGNYSRAASATPAWTPTTCRRATEQDELRQRRRRQRRQGVEGHLGLRPGHRRDSRGGTRGRPGGRFKREYDEAKAGICGH